MLFVVGLIALDQKVFK